MRDRELFDLMWQAAYRATQVCVEAGHSLADKVTKDSADAAAAEVYQTHRGEAPRREAGRTALPPDHRFVPPVAPVEPPLPTTPPPLDPRSARMERDFGEPADDEPF